MAGIDQDPELVSAGEPLERRSGLKGSYKRTQPPTNAPASVAQESLPPLLLKHSQRYCKDGRPYAIASLDILEYEQVLNVLGGGAAEQLDRLSRLVCTKALRGTDRICFFEPGHLIIVLPDTTGAAAKLVLERISQSIASARLHYKNKPMRASSAFQIVACDTASSTTDMLTPDPEALLASIGYKIDEQGNLYNSQISSLRLLSKKQRPFSGSFSVWSDRYVNIQSLKSDSKAGTIVLPSGLVYIRAVAFDQWQAGKQVNLKLLELTERTARFEAESLSMVVRRARVLQQIDHPGVSKLLDFHSYEERSLYLVENPLEGQRLKNVVADADVLLNWSIQLCNTLIYLQALVPPLIPPPLQEANFFVTPDSQLVMTEYELPYLLTPLSISTEGGASTRLDKFTQQNKFSIENLLSFIQELLCRSESGRSIWQQVVSDENKEGPVFERLNSLFKVRAELKKVYERVFSEVN